MRNFGWRTDPQPADTGRSCMKIFGLALMTISLLIAIQTDSTSAPVADLFVGGNETQEHYQGAIEAWERAASASRWGGEVPAGLEVELAQGGGAGSRLGTATRSGSHRDLRPNDARAAPPTQRRPSWPA